eukprot:6490319-Amphidinium_carterae.1
MLLILRNPPTPKTIKQPKLSVHWHLGEEEEKRHGLGGGAARAFCRVFNLGKKGAKPDLRETARAFNIAKASQSEEYLSMVRIGEAAKRVAKSGLRQGTNFGLRSRDLLRRKHKAQQEAAWEQSKAMSVLERSLLLAERGQLVQQGLKEALAYGRHLQKLDAQAHAKKLEEARSVLAEFEGGVGQEQLNETKQLAPKLEGLLPWLRPVPSGLGVCFHVNHVGNDGVAQGLAWSSLSGKSNLPSSLGKEWDELHKMVMHSLSEPLCEETESMTRCRTYGLCLCCPSGKKLFAIHNRLLKNMKGTFGNKVGRSSLNDGLLVCQFVQYNEDGTIPLEEH